MESNGKGAIAATDGAMKDRSIRPSPGRVVDEGAGGRKKKKKSTTKKDDPVPSPPPPSPMKSRKKTKKKKAKRVVAAPLMASGRTKAKGGASKTAAVNAAPPGPIARGAGKKRMSSRKASVERVLSSSGAAKGARNVVGGSGKEARLPLPSSRDLRRGKKGNVDDRFNSVIKASAPADQAHFTLPYRLRTQEEVEQDARSKGAFWLPDREGREGEGHNGSSTSKSSFSTLTSAPSMAGKWWHVPLPEAKDKKARENLYESFETQRPTSGTAAKRVPLLNPADDSTANPPGAGATATATDRNDDVEEEEKKEMEKEEYSPAAFFLLLAVEAYRDLRSGGGGGAAAALKERGLQKMIDAFESYTSAREGDGSGHGDGGRRVSEGLLERMQKALTAGDARGIGKKKMGDGGPPKTMSSSSRSLGGLGASLFSSRPLDTLFERGSDERDEEDDGHDYNDDDRGGHCGWLKDDDGNDETGTIVTFPTESEGSIEVTRLGASEETESTVVHLFQGDKYASNRSTLNPLGWGGRSDKYRRSGGSRKEGGLGKMRVELHSSYRGGGSACPDTPVSLKTVRFDEDGAEVAWDLNFFPEDKQKTALARRRKEREEEEERTRRMWLWKRDDGGESLVSSTELGWGLREQWKPVRFHRPREGMVSRRTRGMRTTRPRAKDGAPAPSASMSINSKMGSSFASSEGVGSTVASSVTWSLRSDTPMPSRVA